MLATAVGGGLAATAAGRIRGLWIVLVLVLGRFGVAYVVLLFPLGAPVLEPDFYLLR